MMSNLKEVLQPQQMARASAIGILAKANVETLRYALATHWQNLAFRDLRPAEIGLVMLRGRIGGDGGAFNIGEATVSKSIIELQNGTRGFGQCLGRDIEKARLAAVFDALWQQDPELVERLVLQPVRQVLETERAKTAAQTAATKVDFFTVVRGED